MNKNIFKAYDIRGLYPQDLNEEVAYKIGQSVVKELGAKVLAVGRDARPHGPALMDSLIKGVDDAGCNVIDLDMVTTPMLLFASWNLKVDGVVGVTASHNPVEYNGIKICRQNSASIGMGSGLEKIRNNVLNFSPVTADKSGTVTKMDVKDMYYDFVKKFADFGAKKFHVVIDCANTMGVLDIPLYEEFSDNLTITKIYCDLNKPYTAHEANPLNSATLDELREKVVSVQADLGIAYDGDADRIGFVDETGEIIPMDLVTGLIAQVVLKNNPGATILYDLRSSTAVKEVIEENGGVAHQCRVGHTFIKAQMVKEEAVFAGELSGHYYFNLNKNGELPTYVAFALLNLMSQSGQTISNLTKNIRRYHHSGEINLTVSDSSSILEALKRRYVDGKILEIDGVKISFWHKPKGERWWFSVRASNTEPVIRLNLEADNCDLVRNKRDELLRFIKCV